ncbi:transmembrane protein, partial [Cystoisospora suis]
MPFFLLSFSFFSCLRGAAPRKISKRLPEYMRVLKVLRHYLGLGQSFISDRDPYLLSCLAHLIEDLRHQRSDGFWSFLDAIRHDGLLSLFSLIYGTYLEYEGGLATMVVAKTSLVDKCVESAFLFSRLDPLNQLVLPGGLLGSILVTVLKGYNLLFFPALAGITNLASLAAAFICLTRLPSVLFSAVQKLFRATKKGIRRGYIKYYSFRVRGDGVGGDLIRSIALERGPVLLATLWQLQNVDFSNLKEFHSISPTTSHSIFSHGVGIGVTQFSSDFMNLIYHDYLHPQAQVAHTCLHTTTWGPSESMQIKCEHFYRRLEKFGRSLVGVLSYVSNWNFKRYVAELLLLNYTITNIQMNVAVGSRSSTASGFADVRGYLELETEIGSLSSRIFRLPFLEKDAHLISLGSAKLSLFFTLRRLYQWRPSMDEYDVYLRKSTRKKRRKDNFSEDPPTSLTPSDTTGATERRDEEEEEESYGVEETYPERREEEQRLLLAGERQFLSSLHRRRSRELLNLLLSGLRSYATALDEIFGRFVHLVMLRNYQHKKSFPFSPSFCDRDGPRKEEEQQREGTYDSNGRGGEEEGMRMSGCDERVLRARGEMPLRLLVANFAGLSYEADQGFKGDHERSRRGFFTDQREEEEEKKKNGPDKEDAIFQEGERRGFPPRKKRKKKNLSIESTRRIDAKTITSEFMQFLDEVKFIQLPPSWFDRIFKRRRKGGEIKKKKKKKIKPSWILDVILNPLFGTGTYKHTPLTPDERKTIEAI